LFIRSVVKRKMPSNTTQNASVTLQAINPVISATVKVFETKLHSRASRRHLGPLLPGTRFFPLNAAIDLHGAVSGTICLSFSKRTASVAVARLLGMQANEIDDLHLDILCELANIISGAAKYELQQFEMRLTPPRIVRQIKLVEFPMGSIPLLVSFSSDIGPLMIAFGLVREGRTSALKPSRCTRSLSGLARGRSSRYADNDAAGLFP